MAACERVLTETGLSFELHANGTNIEGEWDEVLAAVKRCHEVLHAMGVPRIHTVMNMGTRSDRAQGGVLILDIADLHRPSKLIPIDKQADDDIVHLDRFGEADRFAYQAFDPSP